MFHDRLSKEAPKEWRAENEKCGKLEWKIVAANARPCAAVTGKEY